MAKKAARTRTMYMHTIDGRPALYEPNRQIVFASQGRYVRYHVALVPSIKQIHAEQNATNRWRGTQGLSISGWDYGYVRVGVPA